MRPLEIAVWVSTIALILWYLARRQSPDWAKALSAITVLLLLAHAVVEGLRWHLAPTYLVAFCLAIICAWPTERTSEPSKLVAVVGGVMSIVSAGLGMALPVFQLPKPTGPHPVGTVTLHLIDPARSEPRTDRADGHRELMVQVWYPAANSGPRQPYRSPAETTLKTRHLTRVLTHSTSMAPAARSREPRPVVLFSPSAGGRRNHNTIQAEHLASHGFVVVGLDHPFDTDLVVFPDGRDARAEKPNSDDDLTTSEERLQVRVADARFVLDELARLNADDPNGILTGLIDLSRVGIFGHSFGGAVAAEMCLTDPRVLAGVNFDGSIFGAAATKGFGKPFLFFREDLPMPAPEAISGTGGKENRGMTVRWGDDDNIRRGLARQSGLCVTIRGARHVNYCDSPHYSPVRRMTRGGSIDPMRMGEIMNAYLLSYLRGQLEGEDDGLLNTLSSPYPEVLIERITNDES